MVAHAYFNIRNYTQWTLDTSLARLAEWYYVLSAWWHSVPRACLQGHQRVVGCAGFSTECSLTKISVHRSARSSQTSGKHHAETISTRLTTESIQTLWIQMLVPPVAKFPRPSGLEFFPRIPWKIFFYYIFYLWCSSLSHHYMCIVAVRWLCVGQIGSGNFWFLN